MSVAEGVDLTEGMKLSIQTRNTKYDIEIRADGFWIKGHDLYCPDWTKVEFRGSHPGKLIGKTRPNWIGVDHHMEWWSNEFGTVTTSAVESIIRRN